MKRIALFLPDLRLGGAERVFLTLAQAFVKAGHSVDLVLARAEGGLLADVPEAVRVVDLRAVKFGPGLIGLGLSTTLKLAGYLWREQPDALLSTLTGTNLAAVLAHRLARSRTRLVLREACSLRNLRHPARLWLMRWLYPKADALIALTEAMRQELVEALHLPPERVMVIPNPIDLAAIEAKARAPLEHPWFGDEAAPVILGVGRLAAQKNFAALIRAFALVREQTEARLLILGEGPQRPELEQLIHSLGLSHVVALPGADANPYRWLSRARLFVLTSLWEGYPNVVLEALATGLPIVATAYDSSLPALLEGAAGSRIVPPHDLDALKKAILMELGNPSPNREAALPIGVTEAPRQYLGILGI